MRLVYLKTKQDQNGFFLFFFEKEKPTIDRFGFFIITSNSNIVGNKFTTLTCGLEKKKKKTNAIRSRLRGISYR